MVWALEADDYIAQPPCLNSGGLADLWHTLREQEEEYLMGLNDTSAHGSATAEFEHSGGDSSYSSDIPTKPPKRTLGQALASRPRAYDMGNPYCKHSYYRIHDKILCSKCELFSRYLPDGRGPFPHGRLRDLADESEDSEGE